MAEGKTSKRSRSARPRAVQLPAHLDIASVGELKQTLSASLAAASALVLDAGAVEHVDCAGLQLLFAFRQAAQQRGYSITWTHIPACLRDAAALLGMADVLGADVYTDIIQPQQGN